MPQAVTCAFGAPTSRTCSAAAAGRGRDDRQPHHDQAPGPLASPPYAGDSKGPRQAGPLLPTYGTR
jgi:hypothetical protein